MGAFNMMDLLGAAAQPQKSTEEYSEVMLSPYDVQESASNFYSQDGIEELAHSFLAVGQQAPTVLAKVGDTYRIVSGHRRNKANIWLIEHGYEQYRQVKYLYREMTEPVFELSLLIGNAYNRELTAYEKTEQVQRLKDALIKVRDTDGVQITGRLRYIIADILGESPTNVARMEQINKNATPEVKDKLQSGQMGVTAAYEASKLPEEKQKEITEDLDAAGDRAKAIAKDIQETAKETARQAKAAIKQAAADAVQVAAAGAATAATEAAAAAVEAVSSTVSEADTRNSGKYEENRSYEYMGRQVFDTNTGEIVGVVLYENKGSGAVYVMVSLCPPRVYAYDGWQHLKQAPDQTEYKFEKLGQIFDDGEGQNAG